MNDLKHVQYPSSITTAFEGVWLHHGEILALTEEGDMLVLGVLKEALPPHPKTPRARKEKSLAED